MASMQSSLVIAFLLFFISPPTIESHESGQKQKTLHFKELEGCQKGKSVEGLGRVKQYLHTFGYLSQYNTTNTNANNFAEDDYFDDVLEKAITTYQHNYRLNVTGVLDTQTVQQMMLPRCGVPDIINRSSTRSGKKRRNRGSPKLHTVSHYAFFEGSPIWPSSKTHLTYGFIPNGAQVVDAETFRSTCSRAFGRWSSVSQFTFEEVQDYSTADIKIGFFSGDHGDGAPFDGPGHILAHAFPPTRGLFHLDADENWSFNVARDETDVESVTTHEIGHLLGLGHSLDHPEAIMYPTISPGTRKVELQQDDVQGIRALYNLGS